MSIKTASPTFGSDQLNADASQAVQCVVAAASLAPELVAEWVKGANGAAVQAVALHGEGAARKAARRGLNVLKSRGVPIPQATHVGSIRQPSAGSAAAGKGQREAWLLPPDNSGATGIVLAERVESGKYASVFCFLRGDRRLLRVQSGLVSHSKLKANMDRSLAGAGYSAIKVPWNWAQQRIATCRKWHADNSVAEPMGLLAASAQLEPLPEPRCAHPFDEEGLELDFEDAQKLAKDSVRLHQLPEFRSWLPTNQALQQLLAHVGQRLDESSLGDPDKVNPVMREEIAAATDRYFTPEVRQELAANLKDSALSVLARHGEQTALQVAALITVIEGAGLITNPPSDVGFLTAYFEKGVAILSAQQGGRLRVPIVRRPAARDEQTAEADAAQPLPQPSGEPTEPDVDSPS